MRHSTLNKEMRPARLEWGCNEELAMASWIYAPASMRNLEQFWDKEKLRNVSCTLSSALQRLWGHIAGFGIFRTCWALDARRVSSLMARMRKGRKGTFTSGWKAVFGHLPIFDCRRTCGSQQPAQKDADVEFMINEENFERNWVGRSCSWTKKWR